MPLLFAIVGIVALCLSLVVLVGPVLLVVGVIQAVQIARHGGSAATLTSGVAAPGSPDDGRLADTAFADLISREWPREPTVMRPHGH